MGITYDSMNLLYTLDFESAKDICKILSTNLRKRRLERGLSREALTMMSGVPTPTIAKFETSHTISLQSFVALAKALGYSSDIKDLMTKPIYHTMDELETINRNKNRKRGRNEFDK